MRKFIAAVASISIFALGIFYLIKNINFDELEAFLDWEEEVDAE